MDRITFLDNFYQGKNNLWRYILTTFLTWDVGSILTIIFFILILIIIYLFDNGNSVQQIISSSTGSLFELISLGVYYIIAFFLFYICMRFIHHKKIVSLINTSSKVNWIMILKGALLWLTLLGFTIVLDFIIDPTSIKLSFNSNTLILLILCLILFPIQASLEEIFFRGYLMQGIGSLTKIPLVALITTTTMFSLLHFFNGTDVITGMAMVIQTFILGITLGIIVLGENRLENAMGVHIAQNIFATAIISSSGDIFNDLPSLFTLEPGSGSIPFFVPLLVLLAILFWNKRSNLSRIFRNQEKPYFKYKLPSNAVQCFNCNTVNISMAVYCKKCGTKIKNPRNIQNSKECPYCCTLNLEEAAYCRYCGMKIINPKDVSSSIEIQCLNCNTINPNEAIYCKQCGTKI